MNVGAIAGAAGSSGLVGGLFNVITTSMYNAAQRRLARQQNQWNLDQIAAQNEYNSPAAQIARYQEAGLNPNLIYGQISEGNQSQIAQYSKPDLKQYDIASAASTALQFASFAKELKLKDEIIEHERLTNNNLYQDNMSKIIDNVVKAEEKGYNPGILANEEDLTKVRNSKYFERYQAQIDTLKAGVGLKDLQKSLVELSKEEKNYLLENVIKPFAGENAKAEFEMLQNSLMMNNYDTEVYKEFKWLKPLISIINIMLRKH